MLSFVSSLILVLALHAPDEPKFLVAGDDAFDRLDYVGAMAAYNAALREKPDDPEVLWRLARVEVCQGELEDEPKRVELLREAEVHARRCVAVAPERGEGHTWLAGALGLIALETSMKEQIRMVNEVDGESRRALVIDPRNDIALGIRGSLYRALGNAGWLKRNLAGLFVGSVPDGGYPEAEDALQRAIALAPQIMRHRYELGVLYLDWDRRDDARRSFTQALHCPIATAGDRARVKKMERFLKELE